MTVEWFPAAERTRGVPVRSGWVSLQSWREQDGRRTIVRVTREVLAEGLTAKQAESWLHPAEGTLL